MSSSRQGPGNRYRSREPHPAHGQESDFPPLPSTGLPTLRYSAASRERDNATPPTPSTRFQASRIWSSGARRAERLRNLSLEERASASAFHEQEQRPPGTGNLGSHAQARTGASTGAAFRPYPYYHPVVHAPPSRSSAPEIQEIDRTLHAANSHIRALLDYSSYASQSALARPGGSNPGHELAPTPTLSPSLRPHEPGEDSRRGGKRRKLDAERYSTAFKGFRYGKYGQVEPGQLQMEIVSCDGGMYNNETTADNLLKNDASVYCTKGSRCNIILRHQGGTAFTLSELVIKAPGAMNYSHPVREGMVFITMGQDEALSRTAQYQIQYQNRTRVDTSWPPPPPNERPYLAEREPSGGAILSVRHHSDGTTSTRVRRSTVYPTEEDEESRTPWMPREFAVSQPEFNVTTECSDDEEEPAFAYTRTWQRTPNRIGSLPFETHDSDSDEGVLFGDLDSYDSETPPLHRNRNMSLAEACEAHAYATQEAVRAVGGELLTPHARFHVEKRKRKCTIRFDPPVSGKFILLKMWSSRQEADSNIDIQSIIARGFAGPRYFPSVQLV